MFEPPSNPPKKPLPDDLYVAQVVATGQAAQRLRAERETETESLRILLQASQIEVGECCDRLRSWGFSRRQIAEMLGNRNPQYDEQVYRDFYARHLAQKIIDMRTEAGDTT